MEFSERDPGDLVDLGIVVGELATLGEHQEVVNGLVDPVLGRCEGEVDDTEGCHHPAHDARLFPYLTDGRDFGGLPLLDMPLRQGPQHDTPSVSAPDEGGPTITIENQPPCGGLLDDR